MTDALTERLVEKVVELESRLDRLDRRDPWTVGRVDYPHIIFAEMQINNGATGKYLRIASLPATGAGTGDSLVIEFFGGVVGSANQFRGTIRAGNNGAFNAYLERLSGDTTQLTYARIVAYTNSGVTTFYLRLPGTANAFIAASVDASGWGTKPTLYPGESESTSTPAGSLAFNTYTAAPLLTQTNAGDLYSIPLTDYSASSTIVGWSSFTTKKIYYKKSIGMVFFLFYLYGVSDSNIVTFTLPVNVDSASQPYYDSLSAQVIDNGVAITTPGKIVVSNSGGNAVVTVHQDVYHTAWTTSGTKYAIGQSWYFAA